VYTVDIVLLGGPRDWNLSFLCTKSLSALIRSKTDSIGALSSGFKVDEFLDALASVIIMVIGVIDYLQI